MQVPLEIAFHNMEPSEFVEAEVRERVNTLERYSDRITRCSVSVEARIVPTARATSTTFASRSACPARDWW
jgi:ribosome-associated translation inhibitor RaiA